MKIYKVSQQENTGYDTYSSMIVAAPDKQSAKRIYPHTVWNVSWNEEHKCWWNTRPKRLEEYAVAWLDSREMIEERYESSVWANNEDNITVEHLGTACPSIKMGVIIASFHAG